MSSGLRRLSRSRELFSEVRGENLKRRCSQKARVGNMPLTDIGRSVKKTFEFSSQRRTLKESSRAYFVTTYYQIEH